jgi:hypothetical protein
MEFLDLKSKKKEFITKDGRKFKTLQELSNALPTMSEQAFHYHRQNNDFYDWIRDVAKDLKLAEQINKVRSQKLMKTRIESRLKLLKAGIGISSVRE